NPNDVSLPDPGPSQKISNPIPFLGALLREPRLPSPSGEVPTGGTTAGSSGGGAAGSGGLTPYYTNPGGGWIYVDPNTGSYTKVSGPPSGCTDSSLCKGYAAPGNVVANGNAQAAGGNKGTGPVTSMVGVAGGSPVGGA